MGAAGLDGEVGAGRWCVAVVDALPDAMSVVVY
jgi:hypothetical protein